LTFEWQEARSIEVDDMINAVIDVSVLDLFSLYASCVPITVNRFHRAKLVVCVQGNILFASALYDSVALLCLSVLCDGVLREECAAALLLTVFIRYFSFVEASSFRMLDS
jgi:hypothetical protein